MDGCRPTAVEHGRSPDTGLDDPFNLITSKKMQNDPTRRRFLLTTGHGMGAAALSSLWNPGIIGSAQAAGGLPGFPNFAPKAKRAIYLFFSGGPSHIDTFDYKPSMYGMDGKTVDVKTFGRGGHKTRDVSSNRNGNSSNTENPANGSVTCSRT